jgi:hypothetical protein
MLAIRTCGSNAGLHFPLLTLAIDFAVSSVESFSDFCNNFRWDSSPTSASVAVLLSSTSCNGILFNRVPAAACQKFYLLLFIFDFLRSIFFCDNN